MLQAIQNEFLSVAVSEQGAELQSILGADGIEYLWQGNPAYWSDRALNIFPYVGLLTNDSYYLDGQLYHMDIHGIAPYHPFRIAYNDGRRMALELISTKETYAAYPREFVLRVIYTLQERVLGITYEVENRDDRIMYFGLGGHPGFNVPLVENNADEFAPPIIKSYIEKFKDKDIQAIILGCTHYPHYKKQIESIAFDIFKRRVDIISQDEFIPKSLANYLKKHPEIEKELTKNSEYSFEITDVNDNYIEQAKNIFQADIKISKVDI